MTKQELVAELERFVLERQQRNRTRTAWCKPLVGFASAEDAIFERLRQVVSPTHLLPRELLPDARTVVAYFIPFERAVARSNRSGRLASRAWVEAYLETNTLIAEVGNHMKDRIESHGHAVKILPPTHNFDPNRLVSDWSHRHVAFAAGLGTFGVNNMLITNAGCCGRVGSFITSLSVEPDTRPATEACLHRHGDSCLQCVERCVNGALHADQFDRRRCYAMCLTNEKSHRNLGEADVCGKCLVAVPCTWTDPVKASRKDRRNDHPKDP